LNALPFSDQDDDSDQDIDIEEEDENNDFLSQYAEAGCYPKKKKDGKTLQIEKKNRIKQAFFIGDISSSSVKAPKQKKN
jgi:hypothetical protein